MDSSDRMASPPRQTSLRSRATWVALTYAVFATLWIYFSDHALEVLIEDPAQRLQISVFKGLGFVAVTTVLLLLLMRQAFGSLEDSYANLKIHELEIERLKRLYAALSQVNQAIVWTPDQGELLRKVCQVLVEFGGFKMAWIGWHEPDSHQILPIADWGDENGYLKSIRVDAGERPEGQGPTGKAFREGKPCICHDLLHDPTTQPWHREARRRGLRSFAVFPICLQGKPCGTLNVYSDERDFFRDKEIALLAEAALDVSFALDNFAREEARRMAEATVSRERDFSDAVLNSLPGVLYLYRQDGTFLRWNQNFERVTGYTAEEIRRMKPLDFFTGEDKMKVAARIGAVFEQGESSVEAAFVCKDGRQIPYFFTGNQITIDGQSCLVGVGIDLSERHRAEQALRELNETLEGRVTERTGELAAALVRAEAADQIKSAFLATMSHELRTPLNSIIGFTGILMQGLAGPLNAEQNKQLGMVRGSARHLLELINDVLDLSKIEAGQLEVRSSPFDLRQSIEQVVASVLPMAEKKNLLLNTSLSPDIGEMIQDRRRVEQILLNLLNNAIKFTDRGCVSLTAEVVEVCAQVSQLSVRICVADTGIGIRPEDLDRLFQPFRQIDTGLSRRHEGTGLGLAICRRLASLMGGEISVISEWQLGSQFTVILPLIHRS